MKNSQRTKRIVIIVFCTLLIVGGISALIVNRSSDGYIMDILSLLATLIGTVFIAVELRNSQVVTCCDMLIQLNNYFHDSTPIMEVYETLEEEYAKKKDVSERWQNVNDSDIAAYCTFFENIYLLVRNKIAKMSDIDSLFGYRFFLFVHNPYIQEKYILPTSSSYSEIFELYEIWVSYRKKNGTIFTVRNEYCFSESYLKNKLYMCDKGVKSESLFSLKIKDGRLLHFTEGSFDDFSEVSELQKNVTDHMENNEIYCPLTREELLESFHKDSVICVWDEKVLAAFAVIVLNRQSDRNLCKYVKTQYTFDEVMTFDAVIVNEKYRGNGLQGELIKAVVSKVEKLNGIKAIAATVSEKNVYSLANFEKAGFVAEENQVKAYGGLSRVLLVKTLSSKQCSK